MLCVRAWLLLNFSQFKIKKMANKIEFETFKNIGSYEIGNLTKNEILKLKNK